MADRTYAVITRAFGIVLKRDESIIAARAWAFGAFGRHGVVGVARVSIRKPCASCDCSPCVCPSKGADHA